MTIEDAILRCTEEHTSVREKKLVAVSGGRDSVALLHALHVAGHRRLVVCHLDHGLRGRASAGDAAFVKRLADSLGLVSEIGSARVKEEAAEKHASLETAGREARHRFLRECARRQRCPKVLMAHHANDQVETALFNLFRGAGGLKGMRAVSSFAPAKGQRGALTIVRPLLRVTRQEIDAYITAHRLKFREDATNSEPDTSRNRMRLEALPALTRAMGRDVGPAVLRSLEILTAEDEYMEHQATQFLLSHLSARHLDVKPLREAGLALQRRVLRSWMTGLHRLPGIGFDEVEAVRALLPPDGPRAVNLPGNHFVRRSKGRLLVEG